MASKGYLGMKGVFHEENRAMPRTQGFGPTIVPCTRCIPTEVRVNIDSYDTTSSGWR